ncbi:MAG: GGDEF domain-containing protein [Acidobacteriaceae bacterium]
MIRSKRIRRGLFWGLCGIAAVHVILLVILQQAVIASNLLTAAMAMCAALCCLWRSSQVSGRERLSWRWIAVSLGMWSVGTIVETYLSGTSPYSNPMPDLADFLFFGAAIPLLLAISYTPETEAVQGVVYLNMFQAAMAMGLAYIRLFATPMPPARAVAGLYELYWIECLMLALAATVRLFTWATLEEHRRLRLLGLAVWLYVPVEIGMDLATARLGLRKGTLFDLFWSVPFFYGGWQVLRMPIESHGLVRQRKAWERRGALLLQSLFPMVVTGAVLALALSILSQHFYLAVGAILIVLVVQGLESGVMQVNYLVGKELLLQQEERLRTANRGLEKLSLLDPLTGIPNRRHFTDAFATEWRRASRKQESIAVLMIDIDYFKGINDLHGHLYGDECLIRIAENLRAQMQRGTDMVARYGGEEFIILLPDTNLTGAATLARRLMRVITALNIKNDASPVAHRLTVSIGMAAMRPEAESYSADLIAQADRALYRAKHAGRNCICGAGQDLTEDSLTADWSATEKSHL